MPGNFSTNYGLNNTLEYYEYALDSADALSSNSASATNLNWPLFVIPNNRTLINVAAIKIIEVQIPFTYYVISQYNNTFQLKQGGLGPFTVTLPPGNYSVLEPFNTTSTNNTNIQYALASALNSVAPFGVQYTSTYDFNTQKLYVYTTPPTQFALIFGNEVTDPGNSNPRVYLGFNPGTNSSNGSGQLIAPNAQQISGDNYIYVNSSFFGGQVNMFLPDGAVNLNGGAAGPQVAKVPVTVNSGGIIEWQDPDTQKWFDLENQNNVSQFDFFLTLGNKTAQYPLDLNGQSFSLKLGMLVNKMVHNDVLGGGVHNDRVFQRSYPR